MILVFGYVSLVNRLDGDEIHTIHHRAEDMRTRVHLLDDDGFLLYELSRFDARIAMVGLFWWMRRQVCTDPPCGTNQTHRRVSRTVLVWSSCLSEVRLPKIH